MLDISILQWITLVALAVCIVSNCWALRLQWLTNKEKQESVDKWWAHYRAGKP